MWFTDFVIGMLVFSLILIAFYMHTANISKQDALTAKSLVSDAESISSSLLLEGFPKDWDNDTVRSIGITNNDQRINKTKFLNLKQLPYDETKKLFGTVYDYVLFFVNESGDVQNIEGFCGTGMREVNFTYDLRSAYYYAGSCGFPCEEYLKNFMEEIFQADVYYDKNNGATVGVNDQSALMNNINNYDFVAIEHPTWPDADFNNFVAAAVPWLNNGGVLFLGGEMGNSQNSDGFGVTFKKISGTSVSDRLATVVNDDPFVIFKERDNIIFRQAFYIVDDGIGEDMIDIARFNETWVEFDDIKANGKIALARWPYGAGKVLFFSDFDANYLAGDFQEIIENSARRWSNAICLPVNISNIGRENLARFERMLIYDSDIVKMVVYLWQ